MATRRDSDEPPNLKRLGDYLRWCRWKGRPPTLRKAEVELLVREVQRRGVLPWWPSIEDVNADLSWPHALRQESRQRAERGEPEMALAYALDCLSTGRAVNLSRVEAEALLRIALEPPEEP